MFDVTANFTPEAIRRMVRQAVPKNVDARGLAEGDFDVSFAVRGRRVFCEYNGGDLLSPAPTVFTGPAREGERYPDGTEGGTGAIPSEHQPGLLGSGTDEDEEQPDDEHVRIKTDSVT